MIAFPRVVRLVNRPRPKLCYNYSMYGRPVTQAERLNMRLPPDLKRRLDRLAVTRDLEVRLLSIVASKALECGLEVLEARRAELDSE